MTAGAERRRCVLVELGNMLEQLEASNADLLSDLAELRKERDEALEAASAEAKRHYAAREACERAYGKRGAAVVRELQQERDALRKELAEDRCSEVRAWRTEFQRHMATEGDYVFEHEDWPKRMAEVFCKMRDRIQGLERGAQRRGGKAVDG